ncbi:hypothetical protein [Streptomyces malaysiensis]|uniref:hypothetical protein n=1 Tax=Streptomyces malaysiensis TaxID=92644 RepID=UPI00367B7E32
MIHKTWANAKVAHDDLNAQIRDNIGMLLNPPACRRTGASDSYTTSAEGWAIVTWDLDGKGSGGYSSFDTTGGVMPEHSYSITIPVDGLYEIQWGALITYPTAPAATAAYAQASVSLNNMTSFTTPSLGRVSLGRSTSTERNGSGVTTAPLKAGDYLCLGVSADGAAFQVGNSATGRQNTFLEARWVGEYPA